MVLQICVTYAYLWLKVDIIKFNGLNWLSWLIRINWLCSFFCEYNLRILLEILLEGFASGMWKDDIFSILYFVAKSKLQIKL